MNLIAWLILIALIADFSVNLLADVLNLRMLRDEVAEPFVGIYDTEHYRKSQEYLRATTRFGWTVSAFNLCLILGFWFSGGFPLLDGLVRSLEIGPVLAGLIYIGTLSLAYAVVNQPFSIYATFVIEERFGFNRTTWKTFVADRIKGLVLALLLGGPLLGGVLAFFSYAGAYAWLYCWIGITAYMLVVQFIAPTWIMPLFNKFAPLEDPDLKRAILSYADSIGFSLRHISVMDGSKRSDKSNAFFSGFGRNKRIVLFDTLVERHTLRELVAVLAHEMGHYKMKHIFQGLLMAILQTGAMLFLMSFFLTCQGLFDAFYLDRPSVYAGLVFFGLLFTPIDFFLGLSGRMLSRRNEFKADRFSAETYRRPGALVDALKKLSVHNLSNLCPHPLYVFLNYSHPPVLKRIEAIHHVENPPGE